MCLRGGGGEGEEVKGGEVGGEVKGGGEWGEGWKGGGCLQILLLSVKCWD